MYKSSVSGAYLARQLAKRSAELNYKVTRIKNIKGIANGLTSITKRFKYLDGRIEKGVKELTKVEKVVTKTTKGLEKMLEKVPGKDVFGKMATAGAKYAPILISLGAVGMVMLNSWLDDIRFTYQDKQNDILNKDLGKAYSLAGQAILKARKIDKDNKEAKLENQRVRDRIYGLEKQLVPIREKANNALDEVRRGRGILEEKIATARKLGNDALAAANSFNTKNSNAIAKLQADFNKYLNGVNNNFQAKIEATVDTLKKGLTESQSNIKKANDSISLQSKLITSLQDAVKPLLEPKGLDNKAITDSVLTRVKEFINPTISKIPAIENNVIELKTANSSLKFDLENFKRGQGYLTGALQDKDNALAGGITNLIGLIGQQNQNIAAIDKKSSVPNLAPLEKQLNDKFNQFVADNNRTLNIKDLQQSELSKDFDRQLKDFERLTNLTVDQRFTQFQQQNNAALGVRDLKISSLSSEFDRKIGAAVSDMNLTSQQRFDKFVAENINDLKAKDSQQANTSQELDKKIGVLMTASTQLRTDLGKLDTKIKEQEEVNERGNDKLDKMFPLLQLIPAIPQNTANSIRPSIPTIPQIGTEVSRQVCNSANSGCIKGALGKQTTDINNAANNNKNNLLDAFNTGSNAAANVQLVEVLDRLGDKVPGGLSGKLVDGFKWLHLDRVLNILIFAATIQNHLMLSNDIGQTLLGALDNVLTLIGLKDDKGNAFDLGSVINSSVENIVKGIVGAENYAQLSAGWAKANRIYQASTNILNSFMGLAQSILQASEMIAAYTGKIGNALKKGGVVLESAYGWMNPQPKFNRVTSLLEGLQQGASTVQMVTQVPLDIVNQTTELTNASTEFVKAIKEDNKPENKAIAQPEPDELKATEAASKVTSQPLISSFFDLFDGED